MSIDDKYEVLFIDDDDQYLYLMERVIKKLNSKFAYTSAVNGQIALNLIKDRLHQKSPLPKIIFVDLNMPIMDGFSFLNHYSNLQKETSELSSNVVILTSSFNEKDRNRVMDLNVAHDYLLKPIELKTIESFILGLAM